jgi:hypothetical protein
MIGKLVDKDHIKYVYRQRGTLSGAPFVETGVFPIAFDFLTGLYSI